MFFSNLRGAVFNCFFFFSVFLFAAPSNATSLHQATGDPVAKMVERFDTLLTYSAEITTIENNIETRIEYLYQKPGLIKMIFISPHKGATLTYKPESNRVSVRPFENMQSIGLSLSPDNSMIQSPGGYSVNESDIGFLLKRMTEIKNHGQVNYIAATNKKITFEVAGQNNFSIDKISKYRVKFNPDLNFPEEVSAYSSDGKLMETMKLSNVKIDPVFPPGTFNN